MSDGHHRYRCGDGLKCDYCQLRRLQELNKKRESGDRESFHWRCAVCNNSTSKLSLDNCKENILGAINMLTEKFDMIFKVQLPKLTHDLTQLKFTTERIVKQNQDIMHKINAYDKMKPPLEKRQTCRRRSRRNPKLLFSKMSNENDLKDATAVNSSEKPARFRTRRRSLILCRMLHLLNRKMNNTVNSPRRRKY